MAVQQVEKIVGNDGLTALYNNAGVHHAQVGSQSIEHYPVKNWAWQFEVNVIGVVRVTQAFIPLLKKTTHTSARIVINTSLAGIMAGPCVGPYNPSKHAAECVGDILRREMSYFNIKVALLEPGMTWSPMTAKQYAEDLERANSDGPWYPNEKETIIETLNVMPTMLASPRVISDILIDAVLSNYPRLRYSAGGMSTVATMMSSLSPEMLDKLTTWGKSMGTIDPSAQQKIEQEKDTEWFKPEEYKQYNFTSSKSEKSPLLDTVTE